jgi:hypothetical protein
MLDRYGVTQTGWMPSCFRQCLPKFLQDNFGIGGRRGGGSEDQLGVTQLGEPSELVRGFEVAPQPQILEHPALDVLLVQTPTLLQALLFSLSGCSGAAFCGSWHGWVPLEEHVVAKWSGSRGTC